MAEKHPDARPELSPKEVQDRLASRPGGDEDALRETKDGHDADIANSEATARETPGDTIQHISDPTIKPKKPA
jgi:hypothetical protein